MKGPSTPTKRSSRAELSGCWPTDPTQSNVGSDTVEGLPADPSEIGVGRAGSGVRLVKRMAIAIVRRVLDRPS